MAIPKFSELTPGLQVLLILLAGVAIWAGTEYFLLKPVSDQNAEKQKQAIKLDADVAPLRQYEQKRNVLVAENRQLEDQLARLREIVPDEKEVDNFVRMVEGASVASGIEVRRFTAKNPVQQDYYVEVPFEVELDGPYYEVLGFYDRLGKLARIVNVTDLKMGSLREGKSVGNKLYDYSPNETVVAVCNITTFFSSEETAPVTTKPGQPAAPGARPPLQPKK